MKSLKMNSILIVIFMISVCFCFFSGCSMKLGSFSEQTHFSYPNSNIKALGNVKAIKIKKGMIFAPVPNADDIRDLIDQALQQKPGADLIINYKTDTKISSLPIPIFSFYKTEITLSGTAVSMKVGRQELEENLHKIKY